MGRLELLLGPMFADKTTTLIRKLKQHLIAREQTYLIKPSRDTRYTRDALVSSHDGLSMNAITVTSLVDCYVPPDTTVIGIDEGHFFKDIYEFCVRWLKKGVTVYVAALNGTFERKPFESISQLLPIADNIIFLHGVCVICGVKTASCSVKINTLATVDDDGICVGGDDTYTITCCECYEKNITSEHIEQRKKAVEGAKKLIKWKP